MFLHFSVLHGAAAEREIELDCFEGSHASFVRRHALSQPEVNVEFEIFLCLQANEVTVIFCACTCNEL